MATSFSHTNIVTRDPERLAAFYIDVFGCERSGPPRHLGGDWLARGMGLEGAEVRGLHLRLPGQAPDGATLELFSVDDIEEPVLPTHTRPGLMHIAFRVDDIRDTLERLLAAGGSKIGEISEGEVPGVGPVEFVYARDPEDNIVELQGWK